jgi:hypothetical protein
VRGYFLEVWIYKHQFRTVIGSVGRILVSNLNYMKYAVAPLLVMFIPVILIMSHLNLYYGNRPLKIGETAILSVKWKNPAFLTANPLSLQSSEGIAIEAGPLSIPAHSETNWRIKALSGGTNIILIRSQNVELERKVEVSADRMRKISTKRGSFTSFADAIFYGAEKPIPAKVPIEGIYLNYPSNRIETLGIKFHWIVLFFILSLISGFALKGVFKVEI